MESSRRDLFMDMVVDVICGRTVIVIKKLLNILMRKSSRQVGILCILNPLTYLWPWADQSGFVFEKHKQCYQPSCCCSRRKMFTIFFIAIWQLQGSFEIAGSILSYASFAPCVTIIIVFTQETLKSLQGLWGCWNRGFQDNFSCCLLYLWGILKSWQAAHVASLTDASDC